MDPFASPWTLLIARLSIAVVFLVSGVHKAIWYRRAAAEFRREAIPAVGLTLPATVALHLVASVCIIAGWYASEAALALVLFTIVVTLKVHAFWRRPRPERLACSRLFLANVAIVGGLLLIVAVGPGPIALANWDYLIIDK